MPKELQRSILEGFWGPFESPLGVLFETLEGLWLFLGIVWVQNVARIVKMRVSKAILVQVEVARGLSEVLNASMLKRFSSLVVFFWVLLHVIFVRKVLCIMVAASHCNCFSQCVERGRGSAAGAAEDHMTCMLDALQCMGLFT